MKRRKLFVLFIIISFLFTTGCSLSNKQLLTDEFPDENRSGLGSVINSQALVDELNFQELEELDLSQYPSYIQQAIIQNAMNDVILYKLVFQILDLQEHSTEAIVAYHIDTGQYETIYTFEDDDFVISDIGYSQGYYYVIGYNQLKQDEVINYQVYSIGDDRDLIEIDSGLALSPFLVPVFNVKNDQIFYLGHDSDNNSYQINQVKDGSVIEGEIVYTQEEDNVRIAVNSFIMNDNKDYAYLVFSDDEKDNSSVNLFVNSKKFNVSPDTKILAIDNNYLLLAHEDDSKLDILKLESGEIIEGYKAEDRKFYFYFYLGHDLHYTIIERDGRYEPNLLSLENGSLQIRHLSEISLEDTDLIRMYNLGNDRWGYTLMGEEVDRFFIVE